MIPRCYRLHSTSPTWGISFYVILQRSSIVLSIYTESLYIRSFPISHYPITTHSFSKPYIHDTTRNNNHTPHSKPKKSSQLQHSRRTVSFHECPTGSVRSVNNNRPDGGLQVQQLLDPVGSNGFVCCVEQLPVDTSLYYIVYKLVKSSQKPPRM